MSVDRIGKILAGQSKIKRLQKPLEAARVCQAAALCVDTGANIVSFKNGLLTVGVGTVAKAANMQMEADKIIECVNKKIGGGPVKRLRYKIV